jgi:hypothetical protein
LPPKRAALPPGTSPTVTLTSLPKSTLGQGAGAMVKALEDISAVTLRFMRVYVHASLRADEDVRVSANQQRNAQVDHLYVAVRPYGRKFPAGNRWPFQGQSSRDKGQ